MGAKMNRMEKVKGFSDGSYLKYIDGEFDSWCVCMVDAQGKNLIPLDVDYFQQVKNFAIKYSVNKVYGDFVTIYNRTTKEVDQSVLSDITKISDTYEVADRLEFDKLLTTIYMAMISEENYHNTKLGRRIKRLGIYEMLYGDRDVKDSANFMRGMFWGDIDTLCQERGF